jgi:tRNA threonylcarbamoyl adenosine modification protein YeaZ
LCIVLALVIDTSSAAVTAGLVDVSAVAEVPAAGARAAEAHAADSAADITMLAEQTTIDGKAHGELLTPSIRQVLTTAGKAMADLDAVVAGVGPGPFTGLRVGLVTAMAIGDALQIPTYGVCSLDGIAAATNADRNANADPLLVATDARRREVYWARYVNGQRDGEPAVGKPADLEVIAAAMVGAGARQYAEILGFPLLDKDFPTVLGIARCARDRVVADAPSEVLVPLYLRRPDAVEPTARKSVLGR